MSDRQITSQKTAIARSKNVALAESIVETDSNQTKAEHTVFVSAAVEEKFNDCFRSRSSSCSKIN